MWVYSQFNGMLFDPNGRQVACGYSGHGEGVNNPSLEQEKMVGPIPCGDYTIGPAHDTTTHGPFALDLSPLPSNTMFGRSAFLMHGDRKDAATNPHQASEGCIIMPLAVRQLVDKSSDKDLRVVSGLPITTSDNIPPRDI